VIKHNFDQTPKLLETFDQLIRSSEIRSSDPLSSFQFVKFCCNFIRDMKNEAIFSSLGIPFRLFTFSLLEADTHLLQ
jgi:hypothetical protein